MPVDGRKKRTLNLCCGEIANVGISISSRRNVRVDDAGVFCPSFSRRYSREFNLKIVTIKSIFATMPVILRNTYTARKEFKYA